MSFCRLICRLTFRGCLKIPGCKCMCYKCVLPVCYNGDSDSEDEDDKDDVDYCRRVTSPVSTTGNEDQSQRSTQNIAESTDSTEGVVQAEYYNQVHFFTPKGIKLNRKDHDESVVLLSKRSITSNENHVATDGNIPNGTGDVCCEQEHEKSVSMCQQYVNMEPPDVNVNMGTSCHTVPYHNVPLVPPPGMTCDGPPKHHIPELHTKDQTHSSTSCSVPPKSNSKNVNLNEISYIDAEEVFESVEKLERDKSKNGTCEASGLEYLNN